MTFTGYVGTGKGYDGARDWTEVEDIIGFVPYKGTLNVAIVPTFDPGPDDQYIALFRSFRGIKGTINGIDCVFCYSTHRLDPPLVNTFYVIAGVKLRDVLKLNNKDSVDIKLFLPLENK